MLIIDEKMNINQPIRISIVTALLCAQVLNQAQSQGLKIQGLTPALGGANAASAPPSPTSNSNAGKTGLRVSPQSGGLKNDDPASDVSKRDGGLASKRDAGANVDKEYSDFIVAIVDSEPITNREVNQRAQEHIDQMKEQGAALPPREAVLSKTLEELIMEKAQLELAATTGISVSDEEVLQAQNSIAERNGISLEQLYAQVRRQGQTLEQYKTRLRQQMMLQRLRDREVLSKVRITDLEADQFLRDQQKKGTASSQLINISQILIEVPDGIADSQLAPYQSKAIEIIQKIKGGADFSDLARIYSRSQDGKNGGVMGLRSEDRYPALFINAVKAAKIGQVVGPIRSGAGLHILMVTDRQQADSEALLVTQTHARHILLRPGGKLSQNAARGQLADFKRRIEKGEIDFAQLAKENSQDASANSGGDLGWSSPGQFVPEFEEVMSKLSPGQIADPFVSRFGVHLVQVLERKQAPISLKERRDAARKIMQEKKFEESFSTWERELRGRAFIEYRDAPL